jgi:nucleoside-diphosphate-sugar epimerase
MPRSKSLNEVIEVGGPEHLTMNQVAEIFERLSGRQAKKRHIPLPMMRVMSIVMKPVNPALSRQIRLGVFMETANLCYDMTETAITFGVRLTPFEEIARRTIRGIGTASSDEQAPVVVSSECLLVNQRVLRK